jgi:hypothetical protein
MSIFSLLILKVHHLPKGLDWSKLAQHFAVNGATTIIVNGGGGSHIYKVSNTKITVDCWAVTAERVLPPSGNRKRKRRRSVLGSFIVCIVGVCSCLW